MGDILDQYEDVEEYYDADAGASRHTAPRILYGFGILLGPRNWPPISVSLSPGCLKKNCQTSAS